MLKSPAMQADDFVRKWAPGGPADGLGERAGAQTHFIDLCRVLGALPGVAPLLEWGYRGFLRLRPALQRALVRR
jgi:hypothetical protein